MERYNTYMVVTQMLGNLRVDRAFDTFEEADAYLNEKGKRRNTTGTYIIKKED